MAALKVSLDPTLKVVPFKNEEERRRIEAAWMRWSPDGRRCRFCRHGRHAHVVGASLPVYFRPAFEFETKLRPFRVLYDPVLDTEVAGAETSYLVRERIGNVAEVLDVYCRVCARDLRTRQVMCYQRAVGVGETVGVDGRVIHPANEEGSQ